MEYVIFALVGAIAGWLANLVVNKGSGSLLTNIVVGVVGSFLGGWLFRQFGSAKAVTGLDVTSILVSFVGAVVLLVILKALSK